MNALPNIKLPCGSIAEFDGNFSYRCWTCMAVVGSIGQPQECREEKNKYDLMKALGGKGWEYHEHIVEEDYEQS